MITLTEIKDSIYTFMYDGGIALIIIGVVVVFALYTGVTTNRTNHYVCQRQLKEFTTWADSLKYVSSHSNCRDDLAPAKKN